MTLSLRVGTLSPLGKSQQMNKVRFTPFFNGLVTMLEIELGLVGRKMNLRWRGNDPRDEEAFKRGIEESADVVSRLMGENRRYQHGFSDGIRSVARHRNTRVTSHVDYVRGYNDGVSFAQGKERELFDE